MCEISEKWFREGEEQGRIEGARKTALELKKMGLKATIAPTPRAASKCCGISLIVQEEDLDKIRECVREQGIEILKIVALERDINANRDRYC